MRRAQGKFDNDEKQFEDKVQRGKAMRIRHEDKERRAVVACRHAHLRNILYGVSVSGIEMRRATSLVAVY